MHDHHIGTMNREPSQYRRVRVTVWVFVVVAIWTLPTWAGNPKMKAYRERPEAVKINAKLLELEHKVRTEGASIEAMASQMGIARFGDAVLLDLVTVRDDAEITEKLRLPGVTLRHASIRYGRISAAIDDLTLLYSLAKLPEVRLILPEYGGKTHDSLTSGPKAGATGAPERVHPKRQ